MSAKVEKLSAMLAKRTEVLGSEDRFPWPVDDDKEFTVKDSRLASTEWREELEALQQDVRAGEISGSEFSEAFIELLLDDEESGISQSEDYLEMFSDFPDPLRVATDLLTETVRSWAEQTDPTRRTSRSTRRSAKRH